MHILIGALVGAAFAVAVTVGMSLVTGRKPNWKHVALAALGGAVSGAIASATLGAGGLATATLGRQAVGFGVGGAVGGASERVAENALEGRHLEDGVVEATAIGGASGLVSLGVTRGGREVATRFFPRTGAGDVTGASRNVWKEIMTAPTPGTGSGFLRGMDQRRDALAAEAQATQPAAPPVQQAAPVQAEPPRPAARGAIQALQGAF